MAAAASSTQVDVSGRPIITSDGRCLDVNNISTGDELGNNVVILLNTCDVAPNISDGQKWTIMTQGPHISNVGFAIVLNSKTGKCVDINLGTVLGYATMYECGGRVDGQGTESIWQAVGYTKGSADSGKQLTFPLRGALKNNGVGAGNVCWTANTTTLGWADCDPINPTAAQKFTVGSVLTPTPSQTSDSVASSSSTPVGAIAGGVVGGIVLLGIIAVLFFLHRRRQQRRNAGTQPLSPNRTSSTKIEPFIVAGRTEGSSSSSHSKPATSHPEMSTTIIPAGQDLPSLSHRPGIITTGTTGPRTATSAQTDLSSPIPSSVISSHVTPLLSSPRTVEQKTASAVRRPVDLTTPTSSSAVLPPSDKSTLSYPDPYDPHAKRPPVDATVATPLPPVKRERQTSESSIAPSASASNFPSPSLSMSQAEMERAEEARAFAAVSGEELRERRIQRADRPQDFGPVPVGGVDLPPDYDQATEPLSR